ncbi:MAG: GAF domain-containing protein [Deltaproteobacteria bacterium]|nr:MAG: GAF domain-containing protein [Deltaproteobacteria bacterium]
MGETMLHNMRGAGRRELAYAMGGMLLGVMAPLGWIVLRLMIFWQDGAGLMDQVIDDMVRTPQQIALYLYMCGGTAMVLGAFGYFVGQATQQIHDRALDLNLVNREMAEQKAASERRFRDLDHSIKNFHAINADLQRSVNRQEVLRRTADGLHEVIGFDRVNVLMLDPERRQLEFAVYRDRQATGDKPAGMLPLDERAGCIFKATRDRKVLLVEDVATMPDEYRLKPPYDGISQLRCRSFIICPIVVRDQAVGVICVDKKHQKATLVDTDVDTVKLFADQVASSLARIHLLEAVEALTRQLEHTFAEFLKYREQHATLIRSLRDTIASNSEATSDISSGAGVIQEAVTATRSSLGQISVSIDQVSHNLKSLNEFVESSIAAMTEIHYTVNAVQESGVRSHAMSETVKGRAEDGVAAVSQVIEGMRGIVRSVEQAESAIDRLSRKSEEVGTITSVITGLTQKTSLLALNASIIAAQAGEHGRSFAVVADEVRALAQEAAASTDQINRIIEEIQAFTQETVSHIEQTRRLVDDGMGRGEEMAKSLQQILDSSVLAMEMAHDIRRATQEISSSVDAISRSTEELGEMSSKVSLASREEAQGAKSIVKAVEDVQSMTLDMVAATRRQVENSGQIVSSVEQVSTMAAKIFDEVEARRQASLAVVEDLRQIKGRQ